MAEEREGRSSGAPVQSLLFYAHIRGQEPDRRRPTTADVHRPVHEVVRDTPRAAPVRTRPVPRLLPGRLLPRRHRTLKSGRAEQPYVNGGRFTVITRDGSHGGAPTTTATATTWFIPASPREHDRVRRQSQRSDRQRARHC